MANTMTEADSITRGLPRTVARLWETAWVADNAEQACAQAWRMFDLFAGRRVRVDRLTFDHDDGYYEEMFLPPWPRVWVKTLDGLDGWDGDTLYPEWHVRLDDSRKTLRTIGGQRIATVTIADSEWLWTTAPGIGTADGFAHKDRLVYPITDHIGPSSDTPENTPQGQLGA